MARKSQLRYAGALAEPLRQDLDERSFQAVVARKLNLLYKVHEVQGNTPNERLQQLAIALAFAHVPGFRFKGRAGRPRRWCDAQVETLWLQVETELLSGRAKSASQAAKRIANQLCWLMDDDRPLSGARILRIYNDARAKHGTGADAVLKVILRPRPMQGPRGALE